MASLSSQISAVETHLVVLADGPLVRSASQLGIPVTVLPIPKPFESLGDGGWRRRQSMRRLAGMVLDGARAIRPTMTYAKHLRDFIEQLRPDIIHSNGIKAHLLTRLARLDDYSVVWHVRDFLGSRRVASRALKWASSTADCVVAISDAVGKDAAALLPNVRIEIIHNAIDTRQFSPAHVDGSMLDQLAGFPANPEPAIRIGLVATYARWKGQDLFLLAASRFLQHSPRPNARFFIIGGPVYQTRNSQFSKLELRAIARELGIEQRVGFIDFQEDPVDVYRALDVVVHASTEPEPFGRTIVEAMSCGKPVIVSQAGGPTEIVTDNQDALTFPPGNGRRLAWAMEQLANNSDLRHHLGKNARTKAVNNFSRQRLGHQVWGIYNN